MDITISILGRTAVADPFVVLGSQTVQLTGDTLAVTPTVPPGSAGKELQARVAAPDTIKFATGAWLVRATLLKLGSANRGVKSPTPRALTDPATDL